MSHKHAMGRVTRRKIYGSVENDTSPKLITPRKSKRKRHGLSTASGTPTPKKPAPLIEPTPKKVSSSLSSTSAVFCKQSSPYGDDGFLSSQVPCEVGWDTHNEFSGSNMRITDILNNLKNDSKESCGLEVRPSSPSLLDFLHSESPQRSSQTKTSMPALRRTKKVRTSQHRPVKSAIKSSDLLKKLQTVMLEFHKGEAESSEADVKPSPRRITRSQKHQEETAGCEDRSLEESFDLFKTKPSPLRTSIRVRNQSTNIQSPSTRRNSSLADDLWSDDDIGDDSFVRVTQAIVEKNGFVSPVRPSAKCQIGSKSNSAGRRFTFTLDVNTENSVVPKQSSSQIVATAKNLPVTNVSVTSAAASFIGKANFMSIPHQSVREGVNISSDNISSSSSHHSSLIIVPTPKDKTGKNGTEQCHSMPSGSKATAPKESSVASHTVTKQSTDTLNTSCENGNIQAAFNKRICEMNRQAASTCQQSNYKFKQVNSLVSNPSPDTRKINSHVSDTSHTFKLPVSTVTTAARGNNQHLTSRNIVRNMSGIKKQMPVVSSLNCTNMNLSWAPSQFIATSTQLTGPGGDEQHDKELPSKYTSGELRNKEVNSHGILSTVTRSMEQNSAKARTVTTVHPKPISNHSDGSHDAAEPATGPNLDVSISDDLLATLAEPDDLLDSQACLELLQSPGDHVASSSSEYGKQEAADQAFKENPVIPNSAEMDHLDFFLMEHDTCKDKKGISTSIATESKAPAEDADFDADDLGPEVLSMLDEVELRASQEKLLTNSSVMCSKSNKLTTAFTRRDGVESTVHDKAGINTPTSLTLEKESISSAQQNDVATKCGGLPSGNKKVENVNLTNSKELVPAALNVPSSKGAVYSSKSTALMTTSNPLNLPTCPPDEIERKRLEALKRRQNKLRLTRKCSKVTL